MLPVTPQPHDWSGVCVSIAVQATCWLLFRVVVVSGSPEDRTQRDPRIRRIWATSPRLPCCDSKSRTPRSRTETLLLPKQACFHLHLYPMLCLSSPRRRGCFRRRISSLSVGREALESSSAVLQTAARPSQLPAHVGFVRGVARSVRARKKARCLRDIGP